MRLWHYKLIPVLPRKQLLSQWRELCCIIRNIAVYGSPNHLLVNKVMSSSGDFYAYTGMVLKEFEKRGYKINEKALSDYNKYYKRALERNMFKTNATHFNIFPYWHNDRYLVQCFCNLQEKYDCGGITVGEWHNILSLLHADNLVNGLCYSEV